MYKQILTSILFLSLGSLAHAADPSPLKCATTGSSLGQPTHVMVTITMPEKISLESAPANISTRGLGFATVDGVIRLASLDTQNVVLEFESALPGSDPKLTTMIQLTFPISTQPDGLHLVGTGVANLTNGDLVGWKSHYELSNCSGVIH